MEEKDKELLLASYAEEYGPEAGPWNTSVKSKYLEYKIAAFFEENFEISEDTDICNIGIGAGSWDRYLSFKLKSGRLVSIDIDEEICTRLFLRLDYEKNPGDVTVVNSDVMLINDMDNSFDIVTMVGSTRLESGLFKEILTKAAGFIKPGGAFYYHTLDKDEEKEYFEKICEANNLIIKNYLLDTEYGFKAQYFKAVKQY